ncbi:Protein of unknown function DUF247, partial [Theobroma cacao]
MKRRSSTSKKNEEDEDRGRRISTRQDQDNSHHEELEFQLHPDLDSAEEDLTEEEVNPHVKIEGEIIPSSSEASLEIGKEQVNHYGDRSCNTSSPCIFRTPFPGLAFQEPQLASIGPYHRGKNLPLDKCKYSLLEKFLSRTRNLGKDLCFYTPILVRDLLLLENQIPFFILEELSALSKSEEGTITVSVSVITMAYKIFDLAFPRSLDFACKFNHLEEPKHLLDLFLQTIRPSNPSTTSLPLFLKDIISVCYLLIHYIRSRYQMRITKVADSQILETSTTSSKQKEYHLSKHSKPSTSKTAKLEQVHLSKSARELLESGIEFRPRRAERFTDIQFKDGVLEIPPVTVNDLFIVILVNGVALEHCSTGRSKDLTAYASFMSSLIKCTTDVECLCSDGIISRFSNDDVQVASSFNSLQPNISDSDIDNIQDSYLYKTIMETNRYREGDGITWLRHCLRDPRIVLFCITNLCCASYWLSLASLTLRLVPVIIIRWCQWKSELDESQKSIIQESEILIDQYLIDVASSFNSLRLNISDSDFDNIQDSYLYKTITETNRYHKGDGITWLRHCLRDPRLFLFCITSLCFASYWLSLASLTFPLVPAQILVFVVPARLFVVINSVVITLVACGIF